MKKHLLLIEDDIEIGELLTEYLAQHQLEVTHRLSIKTGLTTLQENFRQNPKEMCFDAIILDVMLPDGDGFELCKQIRASGSAYQHVPIMMLTAKGDAMDRIIGLEIGADDYLAKPFEPRELVARIKAIFRRQEVNSIASNSTNQIEEILTFGSLVINTDNRTVSLNEKMCDLTGHQYDILYALAQRSGKVTSREQLMGLIKQQEYDVFDRSIDVHISRIRAEIETDSKNPKRIITKRGVGYIFTTVQD